MSKIDKLYQETTKDILEKGYTYEDPNRKGVYRTELASVNFRHKLKDGFPILTLKKTFFKGAVAELLFFLSGSTDIRDLWKRGVNFWDKDWAGFHNYDEKEIDFWKGNVDKIHEFVQKKEAIRAYNMGRIYPAQYRHWNFGDAKWTGSEWESKSIDQITNVVRTLRNNPLSTSMIVNAWNPSDLDNMCLPPCHYGFQIIGRPLSLNERVEISLKEKGDEAYITTEEGSRGIDLEGIPEYGFEIHWQQRSTDFFLGTPINIQYYALLAMVLELLTGHKALAVQGDLKNVHFYDNQLKQAEELLTRDADKYPSSSVEENGIFQKKREEGLSKMEVVDFLQTSNIDDILPLINFELIGYEHYPRLKAEMLARD